MSFCREEWMFDHESEQSFNYASFCQEEWMFNYKSEQSFNHALFCWEKRMFDYESEQRFNYASFCQRNEESFIHEKESECIKKSLYCNSEWFRWDRWCSLEVYENS